MKKFLYFFLLYINSFLISVSIFLPCNKAYASNYTDSNENIIEDLNNEIDQQLNSINWDTLEEFLRNNQEEFSIINTDLFDLAKSILSGNFDINATTFLEYLLNIFIVGIQGILPILSGVAVISILSGVVSKTKTNLLNESTGTLINFFFFAIILLLILNSVFYLLSISKNAIYSIKSLSNIATPTLLTLMTATGAKVSAKIYSPVIILLSEGVTEIVSNLVLPIFVFSIVFCIISNLSQEIKLKQLSNFFKNISTWILGITFTVFTGFLTIQGLTAATIDGVSIRAAKFATKTYIPILGGYLADGFDLILTSCILIKNCFGVVVLLILLSIVLSPIIKIIIFNIGIGLISAIVEPIADNKIVNFFVDLRKTLSILLVSVIAVTFMLFILIMMIIFSANVF